MILYHKRRTLPLDTSHPNKRRLFLKTLKAGLTFEQREFIKKYWYKDKDIECRTCEAKYKLEPDDDITIAGHYHCGALVIDVFIICPNCNTRIYYPDPPKNNEEVREAATAYAEAKERERMRL